MRPDGTNLALTSYGTVSGNVAYVTLPQACYDYEGQFCLSIQLVGGGVTGTMRIVDGMVVNTGASGTVAPTASVPTYQEILAVYEEMQEAVDRMGESTHIYPQIAYLGGATSVLNDMNSAEENTLYYFMCNNTSQLPAHVPEGCPLMFMALTVNSTLRSGGTDYPVTEQFILDQNGYVAQFHRQYLDEWSDWVPCGNLKYKHLMVQSPGSTRSTVLTDLDDAEDNTVYHFLMASVATLPDNYPKTIPQLTQFFVQTLTNTITYQGNYVLHKIQYIYNVMDYSVIAYRTWDDNWSAWVPNARTECSKQNLTSDRVVNFEDGTLLNNQYTTGYAVTDYIPVSFGNILQFGYVQGKDSLIACGLYDSNKNYIGYLGYDKEYMGPAEFVINDYRAAYIRANIVANSVMDRHSNYVYVVSGNHAEMPKKIFIAPAHGDVDGCNVFTTIKDATEYIKENEITGATVRVNAGTYDLTVELASVLANYPGTDRYSYGLQFGYNTHWIFSEGADIKMLYGGSNVNVANEYSPIVICGSCTIENMDIEVRNCQYCIHDDWPEREKNWIVKYINCRMKHNGNTVGTYTDTACIGGGLLPDELVIIEGGTYESLQYDYPVSYHTVYANLGTVVPAAIIYRNVWVSGGFRFADAPWNCMAVSVFMSDCSYSINIGGTHTMFTINAWNNVRRGGAPCAELISGENYRIVLKEST